MKRMLYRALTETLKMAAVAGELLAIAAVDAGAKNAPGGLLITAVWLLGIALAENVILGWIGKLQRVSAHTRPTTHKRKDRRQLAEITI